MIKLISENKWYVSVGQGWGKREYIVDAADNSVSKSTLTQDQIDALEAYLPDVAVVGVVYNAYNLCDTRISNKDELGVLGAYMELVNMGQIENF
jgi:hypothetical protein